MDTEGIPHIRPMNITVNGQFTWNGLKRITKEDYVGKEDYSLLPGDVLFNNTNSKELVGKTCLIVDRINGGYSNHMTRIRVNERCESAFLAYILYSSWQKGEFLKRANRWIGQAGINIKSLSEFQIPLPPLQVQEEIIAEIEGYQKVIDGARTVVDHYRPHIPIDPDWPMVALEEVCDDILSGGTPSTKNETYWQGDIPWITSADITDIKTAKPRKYITKDAVRESATNLIKKGNIIVVTRVGLGKLFKNDLDVCISQDSQGLILKDEINANFLVYILKDKVQSFKKTSRGSTIQGVPKRQLSEIQIPLPSPVVQQKIAAEIEAEQVTVANCRDLIESFEGKIRKTIGRVWGEG